MKKIISIILILSALICSLSACKSNIDNNDTSDIKDENNTNHNDQNNSPDTNSKPNNIGNSSGGNKYQTAILDYSDSILLNGVKTEYEIRDYEFAGEKVPTNFTFKHKGEEVTISRSDTTVEYVRNNYYPVYQYGYVAWFNPNGDLECYNWGTTLSEVKRKCSEEEAIRVASEFVSEIADLDLYTVSIVDVEHWNMYTVYFTKYVDGIKTTEELQVSVNYHGELDSYVADMFNQFSTDTKNPFDMNEVEKTARERVNSIVGEYKQDYDRVEYDESFRLTKLKDGTLAIHCVVDIHAYTDYGDGFTGVMGGLIEMLVMQ